MPRGDGTGPFGLGPMTGRAAGFCAGYPVPGFMNPWGGRWWFGRGGFWGRGGGRGWRHWYYATGLPGWARAGWLPAWGIPFGTPFVPPFFAQMTREQEVQALKAQADYFQKTLEEIKKQIEELEASQKEG